MNDEIESCGNQASCEYAFGYPRLYTKLGPEDALCLGKLSYDTREGSYHATLTPMPGFKSFERRIQCAPAVMLTSQRKVEGMLGKLLEAMEATGK
ncbi:MAG: hypothetical protein IH845_00080 [Nanoarchaeota archaeon]|nr:hypothetical protein [Nanoarchaeota archaeon]